MTQRIISFDVGIKNLAYCVANVNNVDHQWNIQKWGVIDLTGWTQPTCCHCKNKALFEFQGQTVCKKHAKLTSGIMPPVANTKGALRWKLEKLRTVALALGHDATTVDEKKKTPLISYIKEALATKCLTPIGPPRAAEMDMIDLGRRMTMELDMLLKGGKGIDAVLVENQIGTIATRMRTLQGMIYQYFIIRHPKSRICTISSSNKLKVKFPLEVNEALSTFDTTSYAGRKKMGVVAVRSWLGVRGDVALLSLFERSKKKDDLADSLLQLVWYTQSLTL